MFDRTVIIFIMEVRKGVVHLLYRPTINEGLFKGQIRKKNTKQRRGLTNVVIVLGPSGEAPCCQVKRSCW